MKKSLSIFFVVFLCISCNLKEEIQKVSEKLEMINSDLRKQFDHPKIFINIGWGSTENSNYVIVDFYEFNMDSKNYSEFKKLSNEVIDWLVFKSPKFKEKEFIEVRFTDEKRSDEITSFTKFKVKVKFNTDY